MWTNARYPSIGVALLLGGIASATVSVPLNGPTASVAAISQPAVAAQSGACLVAIDRSGSPGVWQVTRQSLDDGACVCYAYTGPNSQAEAVEQHVADLQEKKRCDPAPVAAAAAPGAPAPSAGPAVAAAGVAAAVAVGVTSASKDSPGG